MTRPAGGPWHVRVYAALLRLLPTALPRDWREDMVGLFADRLADTPGGWARATLLVRCVADAVRHGGATLVDAAQGPARASARVSRGWAGSLAGDVRFATRVLARRPLFTAISVLTLGLGIGGTTAMFSVVDGVLLRELAYRDPASIVSIWKAWPHWREIDGLEWVWDRIHITWDDYLRIRDGASTLGDVAAFGNHQMVLTGAGAPDELSVGLASANLFELLGVRPFLGRTFAPDEVPPEGAPARVVVLSHQLWTGRFGGDPAVVGRVMVLDGSPYEVVGVLPEGFRLESDLLAAHENGGVADRGLRDLWGPVGLDLLDCGNCYELIGRLLPGHSAEQARAEVQALMQEGPESQVARVIRRKAKVTTGLDTPLFVLLGAAGVLLLIACTNVAGLLLGEAPLRRQEVAVRSALGAHRGLLLRQLLIESALLGLSGAALGVLLAWWGTRGLLAVAPPLPRLDEVGISLRVLAFATAAGVGTGILFGLAPALSLARYAGRGSLRARRVTADAATRAMQAAVVAVQVGLTVVLLVGGGLFGASLSRVLAVNPGFAVEGLAAFDVTLPPGASDAPEDIVSFYANLMTAVEGVAGVTEAAYAGVLPFPGGRGSTTFGFTRNGEQVWTTQWARRVTPNYHRTLGIPLLRGRLLSEADGPNDPPVMLISESLAERNWPGESPLGVTIDYAARRWTVVGVVGDVRQRTLGADVEETFYFSSTQLPGRGASFAARVAGDVAATLPAIQAAVWSVHPDVPITRPGTLVARARASEADDRFRAVLMWVFAALAALLAAVGIFGVTARSVATRSRELGIRSALGARAGALVGLVLREGLVSGLVGTAVGLLVSLWLSRLVAHLLFGVGARDPGIYGGVAVAALTLSAAAAYLPARRATAIAPMEVMRDES